MLHPCPCLVRCRCRGQGLCGRRCWRRRRCSINCAGLLLPLLLLLLGLQRCRRRCWSACGMWWHGGGLRQWQRRSCTTVEVREGSHSLEADAKATGLPTLASDVLHNTRLVCTCTSRHVMVTSTNKAPWERWLQSCAQSHIRWSASSARGRGSQTKRHMSTHAYLQLRPVKLWQSEGGTRVPQLQLPQATNARQLLSESPPAAAGLWSATRGSA